MEILHHHRNSSTDFGKVYFWTATIKDWNRLLKDNHFKDIIIESLQHLTAHNLVTIFGFVIMPNHIHLLWRLNKMNGKEKPVGSFLKFTAHMFKKSLLSNIVFLNKFKVRKSDRHYQFWQNDPMAIEVYSRHIILQKLDYTPQPYSRKMAVSFKSGILLLFIC